MRGPSKTRRKRSTVVKAKTRQSFSRIRQTRGTLRRRANSLEGSSARELLKLTSLRGLVARVTELRERREHRLDRQGEADALRISQHHRVDADHPAILGDQRAPAVARSEEHTS